MFASVSPGVLAEEPELFLLLAVVVALSGCHLPGHRLKDLRRDQVQLPRPLVGTIGSAFESWSLNFHTRQFWKQEKLVPATKPISDRLDGNFQRDALNRGPHKSYCVPFLQQERLKKDSNLQPFLRYHAKEGEDNHCAGEY